MKVLPIPANEDNYQYLIIDDNTGQQQSPVAAIVDPVHIPSIARAIKETGSKLIAGLVTHHHWDHAGGTAELARAYQAGGLKIYGGDAERIEAITDVFSSSNQLPFKLGSLSVQPILTPCHTNTHVCYYVEDESTNERAVFTGDTLFIGGCGRFFEGTAEQMHEALNVRLARLPDDTRVYCGHEYTVANLKFAASVEPGNAAVAEKLRWAQVERDVGRYTVPSTIGEEKQINPFMRVGNVDLQKSLGVTGEIAAMAKLREMKNAFQG